MSLQEFVLELGSALQPNCVICLEDFELDKNLQSSLSSMEPKYKMGRMFCLPSKQQCNE